MGKKKKAVAAGSHDDPGQKYIDGTEPEKNGTLEGAIEEFEQAMIAKKRANEAMGDLRARLIQAFEESNVQQYRYAGRVYFLEDGGVIVKRRKAKE
jgi:hypothetical protein